MTHRQALQDFPDASQVSLHKNKISLPFLRGSENDVRVTVMNQRTNTASQPRTTSSSKSGLICL
jgi:hypothetical protein